MSFPIDLGAYRRVALDAAQPKLTDAQRTQLRANIQLCRDTLIFFTAVADAKGLGGHTGGPYDIVPEVLIADGLIAGSGGIVPIFFDEAGHRVAIQYSDERAARAHAGREAAALPRGRRAPARPPGAQLHPGVEFSSGRLGHLWPYVNGVALANPGKAVLLFGSDGSQMEGNDAEAARLAVGHELNVKLLIDDNDITISGAPSQYMQGYDVARTLAGHGLPVDTGDGEDLDALYARICRALATPGPVALVNKRKMAPACAASKAARRGTTWSRRRSRSST